MQAQIRESVKTSSRYWLEPKSQLINIKNVGGGLEQTWYGDRGVLLFTWRNVSLQFMVEAIDQIILIPQQYIITPPKNHLLPP